MQNRTRANKTAHTNNPNDPNQTLHHWLAELFPYTLINLIETLRHWLAELSPCTSKGAAAMLAGEGAAEGARVEAVEGASVETIVEGAKVGTSVEAIEGAA